MRTLLVTALLLALPGAPRAEGGAPPAPAERPGQADGAQKASGAKAAGKGAGKKGAKAQKSDPEGKDGAKGAGAPVPKPCEPVKPCPIDG